MLTGQNLGEMCELSGPLVDCHCRKERGQSFRGHESSFEKLFRLSLKKVAFLDTDKVADIKMLSMLERATPRVWIKGRYPYPELVVKRIANPAPLRLWK